MIPGGLPPEMGIEKAPNRSAKAAARQRYAALELMIKRSCRRDKRIFTNFLADEGKTAVINGDIRLLSDISHRLGGTGTNATIPPKDLAGQQLTVQILNRAFRPTLPSRERRCPIHPQYAPLRVRRINSVNTKL